MTQAIDNFLVVHGFEEKELKDMSYRSVLYLAILFMGGFTLVFTALAVSAWT